MRHNVGAVLPLVLLLASGAVADERRVDFFDQHGRRTGYAIVDERTGRVDFYDQKSRRTGWARVTPNGDLERFGLNGRRQETIRPGPWWPRR